MITVVKTESIQPICPHCGNEISSVFVRLLESIFGKRYIYFGGSCKKVLGVTHRKGFWMG